MKKFSLVGAVCAFWLLQSHWSMAGDWPQWRGPDRTAHAPEGAPVPTTLPAELKPVWKLAIGGGFSSPVVAQGKLVYLDERDNKETVHVIDAASGKEFWSAPFSESYGDEWGSGPRSTPLIDQDRVYVQSCNGEFRCLSLADGKVLWRINFEKDYGVKFLGSKANSGTASRRGNNGCGVIDGDRIFVPVGSVDGATIVCFEKRTGKELWRSQNDEAAYSSLMMATLAGVKQVVAFTADALIGLTPDEGKLLWRVPLKTNAKRHASTPVILGDTVTVNSHTFGMVCTRISRDGDGLKASEEWANRSLKINIATPVVVGKYLYCQGPNKDYVCVDAATGKIAWTQPAFGHGTKDYASTIGFEDRLLILTEDGQLVLIAANPEKYTELGRLQVCGNTWSFPAYANGRLFVRDARQLICLDLAPAQTAGL